MQRIPVIAFAGYSDSGKTTLIEKLVLLLKADGLRVAVIKHDSHEFEIDHKGKDSWRFSKAGANITIVSASMKTAYIEQRERTLRQNLEVIRDVDLILVEGYKNEDLPQIGISRKENGKGLPKEPGHYVALVTDEIYANVSVPVFSLDEPEKVINF